MSSDLVRKFLEARTLIDSHAEQDGAGAKGKKETTTVDARNSAPMSGVQSIIDSKPSKKVVMNFLKEEIARLMDEDSD